MSANEPFDPNKPFYLAATALAPGAPWPLGSNGWTARMRKYAVARQLDPCRRHHSVTVGVDFGVPSIETTGRTDWVVHFSYSTPAVMVSACSRCGRMLVPEKKAAAAPLVEVVANDAVPPGEIWVVGLAEKVDQPNMLEPRILGRITGIGSGAGGDA